MKTTYKFINDQKGFSIPSVMIGLVIMGALSSGLTQMMINSSNSVSHIEDRLQAQDFKKELEAMLSDEISCKNTFLGKNVPAVEGLINSIKDKTNLNLFTTNERIFPQSRIRLDKMTYKNLNVPTGFGEAGQLKLQLDMSRVLASNEIALKPQEIILNVKKASGSNLIETCSTENLADDSEIEKACIKDNKIYKNKSAWTGNFTETQPMGCGCAYQNCRRISEYSANYSCLESNVKESNKTLIATRTTRENAVSGCEGSGGKND